MYAHCASRVRQHAIFDTVLFSNCGPARRGFVCAVIDVEKMTKTTSSRARSQLRERLLKQQQRLKGCKSNSSISEMNCSGKNPGGSMADRMRERVRARGDALLGSKFRWINEQMYTSDSASAQNMFEQDESRFHTVSHLSVLRIFSSINSFSSNFC